MKRIAMSILVCLTLALLIGCEPNDAPTDTSMEIDGKQVVISQMNGTVTAGEDVYRYAYSADGQLVIVYPNGYAYTVRETDGAYASSFVNLQGAPSAQTEEELGYISGFTLAFELNNLAGAGSDSAEGGPGTVIVFALLGVWLAVSPRSAWMVGHGWKYKGTEPSDAAIVVYRIVGVGLIVAAIVMFAVR